MLDKQRVDVVVDQNRANIHSLEVGQSKVIWSKKHPWVEEGKGLKCLAAALRTCVTDGMRKHRRSAVVSK